MASSNVIVSTPNKQAVKKTQSILKTLIATYGSLILSWLSDTEENVKLLDHVKVLISKKLAIESSSSHQSYFAKVVDNSKTIGQKLIASVLMELESTLLQIKTFEKRMKDTFCAMMMTYEDAMKVVLNESIDIFDESSIFTAEHVLDIQQLQRGFGLEIQRKSSLLSGLFTTHVDSSGRKSNSNSFSIVKMNSMEESLDLYCPSIEVVSNILHEYPDTEQESHINMDNLELFIQRNNIRDNNAAITR